MNIFRFKSVAILLMTIAVFTTAKAGTLYVASGGAGTGTSWSDPLGDIQSAVDTAVTDDTILLAGGTYAVSNPITIGKTVFIRGGYNPATGLPGATPTVVTRAGDATDGLVSVSGVSGGELRDVTLSGGVLYPVADHAYGAGIRISGSTGYALVNCTVSGNKAQSAANKTARGGGVAIVNDSSASLTDCSILDNEAENVGKSGNYAFGAGLYVAAGCSAAVTNGVIARNNVVFGQNGQRGAGVYTEGAVSLFNCLVYNNVCRGSQNNVLGDGLCAYNGTASLALNFCTIAYNGTCGLYRQNGAVSASDSILWGNGDDVYGTVTLTRCNVADGDSTGVNDNISVDPLFDRGYYLDASSLCRDADSAPAGASAVAGLTTSADGAADGGTVDMGFHHMAGLASDYAAIYVSGVGSDANDGKTVGAPFRTLTKALSMAEDGNAIHVAAGLYDAAAGETFPLVANGIAGLCLVGDGPAQVLVDAGGGDGALALQNCPNAVVQGMSFKNAIRTTSNGTDAHAYGGGLALLFSGGVVVENCAFENNKVSSASKGAYGGGAGLFASTATIRGCRFIGNDVASNGGTSYAYGGGVANAGGVLTLVNSELRFNSISVGSNGRLGAGLYANSTTTASNCLVVGNCAWSTTDKAWGDGVYFEGSGTFAIRQCTIAANAGMGLSVHGPTVSLSDTILWGNGLDLHYRNIYSTLNLTRCVYGGHHLEQSDYAGVSARFNAADCATADPLFGPDFSLPVESPYAASAVVLGYQREGGAGAVVDIHVAATGSDETGNGSVGAPYRTLTKAASSSADNAVIHIGAGSYDAAAGEVFPVVFEKIASLRLVGAGETDTIIDGTGANQGLLSFITVADVQVSGLTFTGANAVSAVVDAKQGGAVAVVRSGGMVFRDCRFVGNTFDVATSSYGGGVGFDRSSALVERCWMTDNTVKSRRNVYGGGIGACGGTLDVVACVVVSNKIVTSDWGARGGGVCFSDTCGGLLRNSLVVGNQLQSHDEANGVYMAQGHNPQGAAALSKIEHSTILDNVYSATRKFGAMVWGSMVNTIVRGHVDDIDGTPTSLTYCNIGDGTFAANLGCQSGDPLFRNSAIGNYTLRTGSPCVDAGCPLPWMDETAVDVYGRPRVRGKGPDIGAAEFSWAGFMIQVR